jgi:hypothetical protein
MVLALEAHMITPETIHAAALDAQRASLTQNETAARAAGARLEELRSTLERVGRPPVARSPVHVLWMEITIACAALAVAFDHQQVASLRENAHKILRDREFVAWFVRACEFAHGRRSHPDSLVHA